jgi:hypothetical protein
MKAKWAGRCCECGEGFGAGAEIAWNGVAAHKACAEAEAAKVAAEDAAVSAKYREDMAKMAAGEFIKSTLVGTGKPELMVTGAPNAKMARDEANAFVASIRAAGGRAKLIGHTRSGKHYVGREVVSYYGMSNMGHHEGWAYRVWIESPEAAEPLPGGKS